MPRFAATHLPMPPSQGAWAVRAAPAGLPLGASPAGLGNAADRARLVAGFGAMLAIAALALAVARPVQAQMVPQAGHAWRQATGQADLTTVRINLRGAANASQADNGPGLNLRGKGFWPQWEGRLGIVMDRPVNPLKDSFVLAQPLPSGLKLRSFHVLSDYYVEGGFRATAGLVRGDNGAAWWSAGENGGGLNLSLQRLDTLRLADPTQQQTMPYLGAGFTSGAGLLGLSGAWRFNADVGIVSVGSGHVDNMSRALQGDKSLDDMVRDLRLRPLVKVSVGYSF